MHAQLTTYSEYEEAVSGCISIKKIQVSMVFLSVVVDQLR